MYKPLLLNLQNEIDSLIDSTIPLFHTEDALKTAIIDLLEETYRLINKLEESRFRNSMSKIIDTIWSQSKKLRLCNSLLQGL
jgi:hypothetical protein